MQKIFQYYFNHFLEGPSSDSKPIQPGEMAEVSILGHFAPILVEPNNLSWGTFWRRKTSAISHV